VDQVRGKEAGMPISMEPRENGRVLYIVFTDPWSIGDLKMLLQQIAVYLREVNPQAHMLVDLTRTHVIPPDAVQQVFNDLRAIEPEMGEVILVGATRAMQLLGELVFRLFHFGPIQFYDSMEAAWAYVEKTLAEGDNLSVPPQKLDRSSREGS
jgi:hypothetical protein